MLNSKSNEALNPKHDSISRKNEKQPKGASSSSNTKLCKDVLISLVYKYFGKETPTLKNEGKQKWGHISNEYNDLIKGVLEKEKAATLNAKWRNIVYRAKLMKEPHPFKDPRKPLMKDDLLRDRIRQLRCKLQNKAISHESVSETFPEIPASANFNRNDHILEVNHRLGLSDVKRQFGEGIFSVFQQCTGIKLIS